jgi:hypothetical protein
MATSQQVRLDLEDLRTWVDQMVAAFSDEDAQYPVIRSTQHWIEDPQPIIVRPPRTTVCKMIIETKKVTVSAADVRSALAEISNWLEALSGDLGNMSQ